MLAKRVIPCLDVDRGRVVKGINFVGLRDAGDPVEIARRYNEQGADELTFLDITASRGKFSLDPQSCVFPLPFPSLSASAWAFLKSSVP